jgi:catecholate siderophore receptor
MLPVDPSTYYGMASDQNAGHATYGTLSHIRRLADGGEVRTQLRRGAYARDQRASTIRLCQGSTNATTGVYTPNANCPTVTSSNLSNFSASTLLNRGTQLKIQDLNSTYVQSDYSQTHSAWGLKHEVLAGMDAALEKRVVYGARNAAQGGIVPTKAPTTVGTPADGATVDEGARSLRVTNRYQSTSWGLYAQDLVHIDHLVGQYDTWSLPNTAPTPVTTAGYRMVVSELSKRVGLLYQPSEQASYHVSLANSFNTSGDAYSLSASNVNTPPEQAVNLEIGAKLDSTDKRFTTRLAAFKSVKLHERNTDPLVNLTTLSGRRHVAGLEVDVTGRLTPQWELYGSFMWLPIANIDTPVAGGETGRPSLTPQHSGTVWSTHQLTPQWRVGGGLNLRGRQTPNRNPGWTVPSFVTADLMAEYTVNTTLSVKGNLSNITNTLYADQLYTGHYIPGAGRMLQITASVKF